MILFSDIFLIAVISISMLYRKLLSSQITGEISTFNEYKLTEIRLRVNQPVSITLNGKRVFLKHVTDREEVEAVLFRAVKNSLYAHQAEIIKGYINLGSGYRMGVCGETVRDGDKIVTVKNVQGINIRIPHEVKGCSLCLDELGWRCNSTLIISPPGGGKTTFLRDMAQRMGKRGYNVTIVDERGEICASESGVPGFDMMGCDIVTDCPRKYAFENVLRAMSPDVVITDEIFTEDIREIKSLALSGMVIFASAHGNSIESVKNRLGKEDVSEIFEYFVLLKDRSAPGEIVEVRDRTKNQLL